MAKINNKKDLKKAIKKAKREDIDWSEIKRRIGLISAHVGINAARIGAITASAFEPVLNGTCVSTVLVGGSLGLLSVIDMLKLAIDPDHNTLTARKEKAYYQMYGECETGNYYETFLPLSIAGSAKKLHDNFSESKSDLLNRKYRRNLRLKALYEAGIINECWTHAKENKETKKYKICYIKEKGKEGFTPYFYLKTKEGIKYIKIDGKKHEPISIPKENIESFVKTKKFYTMQELNSAFNRVQKKKAKKENDKQQASVSVLKSKVNLNK